jgi:hypothetical protein
MTSNRDMVKIAVYVLRERYSGWKYWILTGEAIQQYILQRYKVRLFIVDILDLLD